MEATTRDEYGLKAAGVLASLDKFEIFLGLKLGSLFGAAEETSKALQMKDTSVKEAVSAISVTRAFYQRQREDEAFDKFILMLYLKPELCKLVSRNYHDIADLLNRSKVVTHTSLTTQSCTSVKSTLLLVTFLFRSCVIGLSKRNSCNLYLLWSVC